MSLTLSHYVALSRRSIVNVTRQPVQIVPALVFPLLFMSMSSAALQESTNLPGFPASSFMQFLFATTVVQGALFGSIAAGEDMATDIEGGFFERLISTPVTRTSILVGRVAGAMTVAFFQAWLFFGIVSLFGLELEGGIAGMLLLAIVASILAGGIGALTVSFALRTGSSEAVQGSFPLMFSLMFISSAFFPRELMEGWFHDVATINPFSHMIEGLRAQVISGLDFGEITKSLAVAGAIFAGGIAASAVALRKRLELGS
ncbi:MAG: ABC transporter permease [Actinomycetota bacterium]